MATFLFLPKHFLLVGVALSLTTSYALEVSSPGKVFLLGGAMSDTNSAVYSALRSSTGKELPKIVVAMSAAPSLADGLEAYYVDEPGSWSYQHLFTFHNFTPEVLHLAIDNFQEGSSNQTEVGRENIQRVLDADVIFFNGGDQSRHSRCWFNSDGSDSDIMTALRARFEPSPSSIVVAGTSAGAAAMSDPTYGEGYSYGYYYFNGDLKPCAIGDSMRDDRDGTNSFRYDENGGTIKAFGFLNGALVDTHFDARGRFGRLPAAMKSSGHSFGFGVGEDTAVYIDRKNATVYGADGVWFVDSSATVYGEGPHFTGGNITVTYLTRGDFIDLERNEVISGKPPLSSFQGPGYNSNNVFSGEEGITSLKSLASSLSSRVVGHSREKRPTAQVTFYKGPDAKVYKDAEDFYTLDKFLMEINTI